MNWNRLPGGYWTVAEPDTNNCKTDWNMHVTKNRMIRYATYPLLLMFISEFIKEHPHLDLGFMFPLFCAFLVFMEIMFYNSTRGWKDTIRGP